jgi:hypothetical protein
MDRQTFEQQMSKARIFAEAGDRPDYWQGVQRGLRRAYHGDNFGTDADHELWLSLADDTDSARAERGRGYRAGFYFREYCTQNDNDCSTCSLANHDGDCQNNPILV